MYDRSDPHNHRNRGVRVSHSSALHSMEMNGEMSGTAHTGCLLHSYRDPGSDTGFSTWDNPGSDPGSNPFHTGGKIPGYCWVDPHCEKQENPQNITISQVVSV